LIAFQPIALKDIPPPRRAWFGL